MRKVIVITPEDWIKVTEYVEDIKPDFYKAAKAVEVQNIFRTALMVELQDKPEEEKK